LRILYHHRVRSKDGQGVHINEITSALQNLGHDVVVVEPPAYRRSSFGDEPGALSWIKDNIPRPFFELLELGYNIPAFLRLLISRRIQKHEVIYERYSLYLLAGVWFSRLTRIPLILEVNAPLAKERARFGGIGMPRLANRLEKLVWRSATHVLPVTQVLSDYIANVGVASHRITVIANGIEQKRFSAALPSAQAKSVLGLTDKIVLGFTGFLREWHRLETIIDIVGSDEMPSELHLLIAGDGPARSSLERRVHEAHLESKVTFLGLVGHDSIPNIIAAFDIALQPAAVEYASPLKLFEYMALGKAIVAPDQPNIREILTRDKDALLFEPDSIEDMTQKIRQLAFSAELRDRLGEAALSTLLARHLTWTENAKRISRIADQIARSDD